MGKIQWLGDIRGEDRQTAGGKGANLAELLRMGMPVPDGFVVTAPVYTEQANRLGLVEALASGIERKDWPAVEKTARALFASCRLDEGLAQDVRDAYRQMGSPAVAVRSSSTAEDRPDASFAGQHDTALNVRGEEELLRAIRDCWASLWNRRALAYRHSRSIDPFHAHMGVTVQRMVQADAAGVVFTVDPVEERADRLRIEVAPGLGEAVVSGTVTSEVYRVDRESLTVAGREGSPRQYKLPPSGGTDAGAIHQSRGGVLTGIVSVPCRYIHSPFSTCLLSDFDHTWRLLAAFCRAAPGV